jgi:hypothetical protein
MKTVLNTYSKIEKDFPMGAIITRYNGQVGQVIAYRFCANSPTCNPCPTELMCVDIELLQHSDRSPVSGERQRNVSWCSSLYEEVASVRLPE